MIVMPRDEEFIAKEQRVRTILRRLKACHKAVASPRSLNPGSPLQRGRYSLGAGELRVMQDWMVDVYNALKYGVGYDGTRVLMAHAARQSASQGNGMRTIAIEMGITQSHATQLYVDSLERFLRWLDTHHIADDYRPEAEMPDVVIVRSARTQSETQVAIT